MEEDQRTMEAYWSEYGSILEDYGSTLDTYGS